MKFIHTSDWHIGQNFYGYDRTDEHAHMLRQLIELAESRRPDALIVSGDVFDTAQPSARAQRLFAEAMVELRHRCPELRVIVSAGNHDSAVRHEMNSALWRELNIDMIGTVREDDSNIIMLPQGTVVVVPYVNARFMPEGYISSLVERAAGISKPGLPLVLMAHLAVSGCDASGHESIAGEGIIGNIECEPVDSLGSAYDYLALGHIHRQQRISTPNGTAYYSGAPLPLSFDEAYRHGVLWVEADGRGEKARVEFIELSPLREVVTIPPHKALRWSEAAGLLSDFPAELDAYIRLNVLADESLPPDCRELALKLCAGKNAKFCLVNAVRPEVTASESIYDYDIERLKLASPAEIARAFAGASGTIFDDDMARLFAEAEAAVEQSERFR